MPNIGRNAVAKSIGGVKRIEPPQSESMSAVTRITDGIEMIIVVVWKKALTVGAHAGQVHVVRPDDEGQEAEHKDGADHRLVALERLARVVGDDFSDDADGRQNEHVDFRDGPRNQNRCCQRSGLPPPDHAQRCGR